MCVARIFHSVSCIAFINRYLIGPANNAGGSILWKNTDTTGNPHIILWQTYSYYQNMVLLIKSNIIISKNYYLMSFCLFGPLDITSWKRVVQSRPAGGRQRRGWGRRTDGGQEARVPHHAVGASLKSIFWLGPLF
jgi:hypothetical protein